MCGLGHLRPNQAGRAWSSLDHQSPRLQPWISLSRCVFSLYSTIHWTSAWLREFIWVYLLSAALPRKPSPVLSPSVQMATSFAKAWAIRRSLLRPCGLSWPGWPGQCQVTAWALAPSPLLDKDLSQCCPRSQSPKTRREGMLSRQERGGLEWTEWGDRVQDKKPRGIDGE